MVNETKQLNVFLDTNVLKKINGDPFTFELSDTYYTLKNFFFGNNLTNISINIPESVFEELYTQYEEEFIKEDNEIRSHIDEFILRAKKLRIGITISQESRLTNAEYKDVIWKSMGEFINRERSFFNITSFCTESKFKKIIEKAFRKRKPFFDGRIGNKRFSDAGFKDAIFLESIVECLENTEGDYLIVSRDMLLNDVELATEIPDRNGKIRAFDTGIDLIKYLMKEYEIEDNSKHWVFARSDYFKEIIESSLSCILSDYPNKLEKYEDEEALSIYFYCTVTKSNSEIKVIIKTDDENGFKEIIDEKTREVIFEWES